MALQLTAMLSTEDTTAAMRSALGRRIQGALSFHKWSPTCVSETLWASAASSLHCQPDKWQLLPAGESFTLQLRSPSTASKPSKLLKPPTGTTSPSRFAAVQGEALYNHAPDPTDCVLIRKIVLIARGLCMGTALLAPRRALVIARVCFLTVCL